MNGSLDYISSIAASTTGSSSFSLNDYVTIKVDKQDGIDAQLYFKYVKSKFGILETMRLERMKKKLERAFDEAIKNGQYALAEKFLAEVSAGAKEAAICAKGIKLFVTRDDVNKHKNKLNNGHISDTKFEDYTRIIPKDVLDKKKKLEGLFDGYVIYHYWNEKAKDVKKMSVEEKRRMKDPILFGTIKETQRLYFIADWEDEFCDLTFDELVDKLGGKDENYDLKSHIITPSLEKVEKLK